jgi:hypothetical protein
MNKKMAEQKNIVVPKPGELYEKGKSWFKSWTFYSIVVGVVAIGFQLAGLDLNIEDLFSDIEEPIGEVDTVVDQVNATIGQVVALISFLSAWWGRIKAKYKLKKTPV